MTTRPHKLLAATALAACLAGCGATADRALAFPMQQPSVTRGVAVETEGTAGGFALHDQTNRESAKVVRTGSIAIQVDDYAPLKADPDHRVAAAGGHIAQVEQQHTTGGVGWARLTLRVPSDGMAGLLAWLESTTEVQRVQLGAVDVTTQWIDVEARLDNARRTETRLVGILDDRTANLADVLAVERELARVRGEIESSEARMRALTDRVDLATLTLEVSVSRPYTPPGTPALGERVGDTWDRSLDVMARTGEGLMLVGVALFPWLGLLGSVTAILGLLVRAIVRRRRR